MSARWIRKSSSACRYLCAGTVFKNKNTLILVSPDEHQGEFRKLSKNNFLIDEGIKIDGDSLDKKSLYVKVQDVMQERFKKELKDRMAAFSEAHAPRIWGLMM